MRAEPRIGQILGKVRGGEARAVRCSKRTGSLLDAGLCEQVLNIASSARSSGRTCYVLLSSAFTLARHRCGGLVVGGLAVMTTEQEQP